MKKLKILLDTDIGDEIDDALALYFAMRQGQEIIGITTVFKNTDERARITKRLLKLYGKGYENVPVFAGHGTPLAENGDAWGHTCHYHEALADVQYAPDGYRDAAVDFIIDSCEKHGDELCIVAIGPFTNIAKAIERAPESVNKAAKVVIMGGAYFSQYTDWNVMCDVEAASVMFSSLDNLECVGADVTHRLPLCANEHQRLLDCKNDPAAIEIAELIKLWSEVNPDRYPTLHDPLAIYYANDPSICKMETHAVAVVTDGFARGITLNADEYNKAYMNSSWDNATLRRVRVAKDVKAREFIDVFMSSF